MNEPPHRSGQCTHSHDLTNRIRRGHACRHLYVATDKAMVSVKWVTQELIQQMCLSDLLAHTSYT